MYIIAPLFIIIMQFLYTVCQHMSMVLLSIAMVEMCAILASILVM